MEDYESFQRLISVSKMEDVAAKYLTSSGKPSNDPEPGSLLHQSVSLRTWAMMGMFDREVAIYRRLMEHDFRVSFLTYGDASDLHYEEKLGGIRVLCNEQAIPPEQYETDLVKIHAKDLEDCHVIKPTSPMARICLDAARLFKSRSLRVSGTCGR